MRKIVVILLSLLIMGCNSNNEDLLLEEIIHEEVKFSDPDLMLEIWRPYETNDVEKVAIFVHGGGWSSGDKSTWTNDFARTFLMDNIISVSINYRLVPNVTIHEQLEDINVALDFLRDYLQKKGIKTPEFILIGHSAGAHLVTLYSYNKVSNENLASVISIDGGEYLTELPENMDVSQDYYLQLKLAYTKAIGPSCPRALNPYLNLKEYREPIPTYLLFQEDEAYRAKPNHKLYQLLIELGGEAVLHPVLNHDHISIFQELADPHSEISIKVRKFIITH